MTTHSNHIHHIMMSHCNLNDVNNIVEITENSHNFLAMFLLN
jgi:hypothetical protein